MTPHAELRASSEYAALLAASERLGRDPLQVQGPGGNTSLKRDGAMWVKASGTWLAEARERDIMAPVDAEAMAAAVRAGDPAGADAAGFMVAAENRTGLRGSIETSVHALMPWPVVLHTHCVATIAIAARADAEATAAERLAGLDFAFIPYVRPGFELAQAICARARPETRLLVLGNHGLVACGETVAEAEALLRTASERLAPDQIAPPIPPSPNLAKRLAGTDWAPVEDDIVHALALDFARLDMAVLGTFYPDHIVFLGPDVAIVEDDEPLEATRGRRLILFPELGAALPKDATPAMRAMARCLGDVLARVEPGAALKPLSKAQEAALLDWDAEKHRQALNAKETQA